MGKMSTVKIAVAGAALAFSFCAQGATYYVSPSGNDANPGTSGSPWQTIGKATATVVAGDSVTVKAGTYNEYVVNSTSGTPSSPITFTGERDNNGNWLTIIDPSTSFQNGWVAAPEVGTGVFKQTGMAFVARYLSINNSNICSVYTNGDITAQIGNVFVGSPLTMGTQCLAVASAQTYTRDGVACSFWNPLGALFCAATNTCYLRLRDGSDPNGLDIKMAANNDAHTTFQPRFQTSAVAFSGRSNVVWQNFQVRNSFASFYVLNSSSITIQSNSIGPTYYRVYMEGIGSSNNIVRWNTMPAVFYGNPGGAWEGSTAAAYEDKHGTYVWGKYMMGESSVFDNPIELYQCGYSNSISYNTISSGLGANGIAISGDVTRPTIGTIVVGNYIEQQSSVGILSAQGQTFSQYVSNYLSDCDISIRLHNYNAVGEVNRTNYTYRNMSWLPDNVGDHFFVFFNSSGGTYKPTDWVYHNSCSGGNFGIQWNANVESQGPTPNLRFLNNIWSTNIYFDGPPGFSTDANATVFDYNYITPASASSAAWVGPHTIKATNQWANVHGMNFILPPASKAIDAALDTSIGFSVGGQNFLPLPDTATKHGQYWDMGALEFPGANYFMNSALVGTSHNTGLTLADAFTNFTSVGGTDGQYNGPMKPGDSLWIDPGVGYKGNRTGSPDFINIYNIPGSAGAPITFRAIQTNGLLTTPPFVVSGQYFTLDGHKYDNWGVNLANMANLYAISNNINWHLRGVYGFGSNNVTGIYAPNAGPGMQFLWLDIDPFTFNTNNWPFGGSESGVGANTHAFSIVQNTGESLFGGRLANSILHNADQCGIFIPNNNAPDWSGFMIDHNVVTMVGDACARLAGGFEVHHNIFGSPEAIHGHPNGVVLAPQKSLFHHNIIFNTLDTMFYSPGGGPAFNSTALGLKIYDNLFYTTWDWSFQYTNVFTTNGLFVGHGVAGIQILVEANANNIPNWLPQVWTNFVLMNNTIMCGMGAVPTNLNAGVISPISLPNRYAPGNSTSFEPGPDRGWILIQDMVNLNNCFYNVSPAGSLQTLGGWPGWLDRYSTDTNNWSNPALVKTAGILFDPRDTNTTVGSIYGANHVSLDYNVLAADQAASKQFVYLGPGSTNVFLTAEAFNTAFGTNGYIHNSSSPPGMVDTNRYDFKPRVFDTALVGMGTNISAFTNAPGGLPGWNLDLYGVTRPARPSIGAFEPDPTLILHYTFDDLYPATGTVAIGSSPFVTDINGYGSTMLFWGTVSTPTNWPNRVAYTNALGPPGFAAEFISNTNPIPSYGNFSVADYGGVTNIGAFSNLSAITITAWVMYYPHAPGVDGSCRIIDTQDGSPGAGATWSLGRNSAYQTSFDLFTNRDYNTQNSLHINFPDNESTDWHFYAATFNCSNQLMYGYLDGTNFTSRNLTGYSSATTNLIVGVPQSGGVYPGMNGWLGIGCATHSGSPQLYDDSFPNNGWMDGQVHDLRVYNRDLGAGEILALYLGGGASVSSGGGSGPTPPPPNSQKLKVTGHIKVTGGLKIH
jgi:hypothetical protein